MILLIACWTTLSLTVGIPNGRKSPELGLGIRTCLTGDGIYLLSLRSLWSSLRFWLRFPSNSSMDSLSTPPAPLFALTSCQDSNRFGRLYTLSISEYHFLFFILSLSIELALPIRWAFISISS